MRNLTIRKRHNSICIKHGGFGAVLVLKVIVASEDELRVGNQRVLVDPTEFSKLFVDIFLRNINRIQLVRGNLRMSQEDSASLNVHIPSFP